MAGIISAEYTCNITHQALQQIWSSQHWSSEVAATEEPHFQMRKQKEKLRNAIKVRQLARSNAIKVKKRPFQSKEDLRKRRVTTASRRV